MRFSLLSFGTAILAACLTSASPSLLPRTNSNPTDMSTSNSSGCATGPLDYNRTCFNHPEFLFDLPRPGFEFLFHLQCDLGVVYPIGDGPYGNRKAITFTGGVFDGPLIQGVVLPGGADWLLTTSNGTVSMPDTRYNLKTHDGAYIYLQTRGTRTGPKDILDKLTTDPTITPDQYRFRLTMMFETGDPRYQWLNKVVAVAAAGKSLTQVVYDAYVIT